MNRYAICRRYKVDVHKHRQLYLLNMDKLLIHNYFSVELTKDAIVWRPKYSKKDFSLYNLEYYFEIVI